MTQTLSGILVNETKTITFDFTGDLASGETISTKVVVATVYSGVDATPSTTVSGTATSSGAVVSQAVLGVTIGVLYQLLCTITTSASQTLKKSAFLACVSDIT